MKKTIIFILFFTLCLTAGLWGFAFTMTYKPRPLEHALVECSPNSPALPENRPLKVMTYNVQYMAGRNYLFYYDLPGMKGPDTKPKQGDVDLNLKRIAKLIRRHNPDLLLLQEMHNGHVATDKRNLLAELQRALPKNTYPCSARTDYWRSAFIPHPKILGPVGMELVTLSKYKIHEATRFQLPQTPKPWFTGPFHIQRSLLEVDMLTDLNRPIKVINTHFEAFPEGSDVKQQQVDFSLRLLRGYEAAGIPWIFGGDLNLLPEGQLERIPSEERYLYSVKSELAALSERFPQIPSEKQLSENPENWLTYSPNRYDSLAPDRTLDYLFYDPQWTLLESQVVNTKSAQEASDHMPVVGLFEFKAFEAN